MKILIESYNNVTQNKSGGVQIRIKNFVFFLKQNGTDVNLFNKWTDKIEDFDLLHIFKLNIEDYQMMHYAKNIGKPVVISSVIPLENRFRIMINRLICKILPVHTGYSFMEEMLKMADAIIAQTAREANFISKNYNINKNLIHVIPNGSNTNITDGNPSLIIQKIRTEKPYILQVGRFDTNKNQLSVIKALKGSNIPVVFIGGSDPNELDYFKRCKAEATDNMYFLDWLNNDDPLLASAYSNAQVVVLPSYKEIFGNSLIEGGAAGANLVATKEMPINDWGISDYCLTINPHDVKNIKEVLLKSYYKPKNKLLSNKILETFSWDTVIKQHISVYEHLINKNLYNIENLNSVRL